MQKSLVLLLLFLSIPVNRCFTPSDSKSTYICSSKDKPSYFAYLGLEEQCQLFLKKKGDHKMSIPKEVRFLENLINGNVSSTNYGIILTMGFTNVSAFTFRSVPHQYKPIFNTE